MHPAILRAGLRVGVARRLLLYRLTSTNSSNLSWPSPPPLPREEQREFEELQRIAQMPLSGSSSGTHVEVDLERHPDAPKPIKPDFEGDINPLTGEEGGPKREPVGRWAEGDWSFKGRVSDF